jgi:hypothetical protein
VFLILIGLFGLSIVWPTTSDPVVKHYAEIGMAVGFALGAAVGTARGVRQYILDRPNTKRRS